jgi:hypothetical protein
MIFLEKISRKSEFQLSTFQRVTSLLFNGLGKVQLHKKSHSGFYSQVAFVFIFSKKEKLKKWGIQQAPDSFYNPSSSLILFKADPARTQSI